MCFNTLRQFQNNTLENVYRLNLCGYPWGITHKDVSTRDVTTMRDKLMRSFVFEFSDVYPDSPSLYEPMIDTRSYLKEMHACVVSHAESLLSQVHSSEHP